MKYVMVSIEKNCGSVIEKERRKERENGTPNLRSDLNYQILFKKSKHKKKKPIQDYNLYRKYFYAIAHKFVLALSQHR